MIPLASLPSVKWVYVTTEHLDGGENQPVQKPELGISRAGSTHCLRIIPWPTPDSPHGVGNAAASPHSWSPCGPCSSQRPLDSGSPWLERKGTQRHKKIPTSFLNVSCL